MRRFGSTFPISAEIFADRREMVIRDIFPDISRTSCFVFPIDGNQRHQNPVPASTGRNSRPDLIISMDVGLPAGRCVIPAYRRTSNESPDGTPVVAGASRVRQRPTLLPPDNGAGILEDGRSSSIAFQGGLSAGTVYTATSGADARSFAVVVPAYNEGLVIGSVVLLAQKHVDRVIVVDDGSTDRTAETARLAGADVIEMPENGGKAKAMMAGFARARALGYEAVVMLDGDGQHDPNDIPAVAAPVLAGVADLVIGSRFLDAGAEIPAYRRAGQVVLNGFTNLSTDGGFATTDSQSGFRALSRQALDNLTFASEGYTIESDMIAHFAPLGLKMTEVPISVTYDVPHKHKKNPVTHGFGVLTRIVGLIGHRRPLLFFGIPGGAIAFLGIGLGIYTFSELFRIGQFHYVMFTLGITALILGLLLISSGLILNFLVSMMGHRANEA